MRPDPLDAWLAALDRRHLADLTLSEVTRALRALSSCYVERRDKLARGGALDGAGKRAAFALFYGPQHFLITREVARAVALDARSPAVSRLVDLGCGTGAAGAAAAAATGATAIHGVDLNPWAVAEANRTYAMFELRGRASVSNISKVSIAGAADTLWLAAYAVNELPPAVRDGLLPRLVAAAGRGSAVLVIEPIGRRVNTWWPAWAEALTAAGAREDDWRFRTPLPPRQRALAKAAGLDVSALTARSLYAPGGRAFRVESPDVPQVTGIATERTE